MMAFWAHGYEGTSMAILVEAMELNSPSIYAAFGSKSELFKEAVALYRATEGGRIWSATLAATTSKSAIETMLQTSAEEFTQPEKPRGCMVVLGVPHEDAENESIYRELQNYRAESLATLTLLLRKGVAKGEIKQTADCKAIAAYYLSIQHGMSIQARDGASRQTLLSVADHAISAWDALV
jgi:AcrR family transcriptional regulator